MKTATSTEKKNRGTTNFLTSEYKYQEKKKVIKYMSSDNSEPLLRLQTTMTWRSTLAIFLNRPNTTKHMLMEGLGDTLA